MRIVIFGAGAVGCVIGGRVFQHADRHGHDVVLVARGAHRRAIAEHGLTLNDPAGSVVLEIPVVGSIGDIDLADDDVVVLAMKTQDTEAALADLQRHAPSSIAVACAQNGVENERLALRRFERVYAVCVMLPALLMEPGVVDASGTPCNAILDIGRFPSGVDATADELAGTFDSSGLVSRSDPNVMRRKYTKLLSNLANPIDALVADQDNARPIVSLARAEAVLVYRAAGIERLSDDADRQRRIGVMEIAPIAGRTRGGGSTWQSLARGSTTTEVDWLNGEISLLGRLHGVPTPVNSMLTRVMNNAAAAGLAPRSMLAADLLALLSA